MKTPHPHAALLHALIDDTSLKVWVWSPYYRCWTESEIDELISETNFICAIGEKPTAPPQRMCELGGLQFPEPESVAPADGTLYWYLGDIEITRLTWNGDTFDCLILNRRELHLTQAAAQAHWDALEAANMQAVKDAK